MSKKRRPQKSSKENRRRQLQSYLDQLKQRSNKTWQDVDLIQELEAELDPRRRKHRNPNELRPSQAPLAEQTEAIVDHTSFCVRPDQMSYGIANA